MQSHLQSSQIPNLDSWIESLKDLEIIQLNSLISKIREPKFRKIKWFPQGHTASQSIKVQSKQFSFEFQNPHQVVHILSTEYKTLATTKSFQISGSEVSRFLESTPSQIYKLYLNSFLKTANFNCFSNSLDPILFCFQAKYKLWCFFTNTIISLPKNRGYPEKE